MPLKSGKKSIFGKYRPKSPIGSIFGRVPRPEMYLPLVLTVMSHAVRGNRDFGNGSVRQTGTAFCPLKAVPFSPMI
jgi:hypothetical protein